MALFFEEHQSYWVRYTPYFSMTSSYLSTSEVAQFPNKDVLELGEYSSAMTVGLHDVFSPLEPPQP